MYISIQSFNTIFFCLNIIEHKKLATFKNIYAITKLITLTLDLYIMQLLSKCAYREEVCAYITLP